MRIDRQLSTTLFHPLQRAGLGAAGFRLPILMYHSLSDDPERGVAPYFKTNTAPGVFRRQMRQLASEGYTTMDLMEAVRLLSAGRQPAPKTVIITFDDGFRDFRLQAFPLLQEHGFTATVFLPTAFIADPRRCFKNTECLLWSEIREMRQGGIGFGSHTVHHPELVQCSRQEVEAEIVQSKAQIEQQLGEPSPAFAFPYAFPPSNAPFARHFRAALLAAGYACCLTTELGRVQAGDDLYRLKRLPVNSLDDPALFRAKLEGGYDWLAAPQRLFKRLKNAFRSFAPGKPLLAGRQRRCLLKAPEAMRNVEYVIITPARNEAAYLNNTIDSVAAQTIQPKKWILLDDGSTDATSAIMEAAAKKHPWIQVLHRPDRGFRKSGGGVMEAFYDGYNLLGGTSWEFLVKLDADLSFDSEYFEKCSRRFQEDAKLGIGGGIICGLVNGRLVEEAKGDPPFHVRGATKIYRRICWHDIGGLIRAPGWDTLDEVKANMLGWKTYGFRDLKLHHHRYAGEADGAWKNWVKNGQANYITGYHPLFMFCKCISRLREKPYFLAAAGLGFGFLSGYFRRLPRVEDEALIKYLRDQQIRRLTMRDSLWAKRA